MSPTCPKPSVNVADGQSLSNFQELVNKIEDHRHRMIEAENKIKDLEKALKDKDEKISKLEESNKQLQSDLSTAIATHQEIEQNFKDQLTRLLEMLKENQDGETPRMQEHEGSRILYCNVLPGCHLVEDGAALFLSEESTLGLNLHHGHITFPSDQIRPFKTNSPFSRLNPIIGRHMPDLWSRGTL